jgi:putative ATP-dependent endonuclease of OLD family
MRVPSAVLISVSEISFLPSFILRIGVIGCANQRPSATAVMFVSRLFIKNFRNFRHLDVALSDGVTCFIGENNSGKTNLFYALRLVLDGNLSAQRRRLRPEDLASGLTFSTPEHVLISIEFAGFAGHPNEEALPFTAVLQGGTARISYRFRPKAIVRDALEQIQDGAPTPPLKMDDYVWEMTAGGDNVDLNAVAWHDSFGTRFSTENLQQGYLVVLMEALRDVEARLGAPRTSPLQQIVEQRNIPDAERNVLVNLLQTANDGINASATVGALADELSASFHETAGKSYAMGVSLGLGEASFSDISRGLKVLLSGYGLTNLDPGRNGLGLNNVLYISMLLNYFERRVAEQKTAGQLLLVEEPEAHLHPQLQRVLLSTLQRKAVQVFITTHSTHITSGVPLASQVVLTSSGGPESNSTKPIEIPAMTLGDVADLERYLDATRSSLLYARKVLLVEGPAEQFVIPALAKAVLNIDIEDEGIAIVPIFGTHFRTYAKLFGDGGISKKCAILADGDLTPSDANPSFEAEDDEDLAEFAPDDFEDIRGDYVEVFTCETTFERELTLQGNLGMMEAAAREVGAPVLVNAIQLLQADVAGGEEPDLSDVQDRVLRTARRFGKARFAQIISKHVDVATEVPNYIREALIWLTTDAPDA